MQQKGFVSDPKRCTSCRASRRAGPRHRRHGRPRHRRPARLRARRSAGPRVLRGPLLVVRQPGPGPVQATDGPAGLLLRLLPLPLGGLTPTHGRPRRHPSRLRGRSQRGAGFVDSPVGAPGRLDARGRLDSRGRLERGRRRRLEGGRVLAPAAPQSASPARETRWPVEVRPGRGRVDLRFARSDRRLARQKRDGRSVRARSPVSDVDPVRPSPTSRPGAGRLDSLPFDIGSRAAGFTQDVETRTAAPGRDRRAPGRGETPMQHRGLAEVRRGGGQAGRGVSDRQSPVRPLARISPVPATASLVARAGDPASPPNTGSYERRRAVQSPLCEHRRTDDRR